MEPIKEYLQALSEETWIDLINKILLNNFVRIPLSMEKATPEEIIMELNTQMNLHSIDKTPMEHAIMTILYSMKGLQTVPQRLNLVINFIAIIRPAKYTDSIKALIIEKSFFDIYHKERNIHYALINYHRTIAPIEDEMITNHLNELLKHRNDGNLLLVALRYFKRFMKTEREFNNKFLGMIKQTKDLKQQSFMLIFVDKWTLNETFQPLCRFIDQTLWQENNSESCLSFVELLNKFLSKLQNSSQDINCTLAYYLTMAFLGKEIDNDVINYLSTDPQLDERNIKSLIRLRFYGKNNQVGTNRIGEMLRGSHSKSKAQQQIEQRFAFPETEIASIPDYETPVPFLYDNTVQYDKIKQKTKDILDEVYVPLKEIMTEY